MKKKVKWFLLCSYLIVTLVSFILANVLSENQTLADVFLWISAALIGVLVIFLYPIIKIIEKRDGKLFKSYIEKKDFATARKVFEKKSESYIAFGFKISAKLYTLVFCFALNDIEAARDLLTKTKWRSLHNAVKYFEILLNLKDYDLQLAKSNFAVFEKNAKKANTVQVNKLKQIFRCIDDNNFEEQFYSDSIYPIIKDIYDLYSSQSKR